MSSAPLVGMHFRPPAKAILAVLPADCPLTLYPEPTNEYDPNAIMVHVKSADIPASADEDLQAGAAGFGYDTTMIREREAWHLGYIARHFAETIKLQGPTPAKLSFTPEGKPQVTFEPTAPQPTASETVWPVLPVR